MTFEEARQITGGLGWTKAMPCPTYGLPASACQIGSILARQPGTTCSICYALKGNYRFPNVKDSQHRRLVSLEDPRWSEAMIKLIYPYAWFRWHDSGDLQSVAHFRMICDVAVGTPHCKHWIPTREKRYIRGTIPKNLCVRFSLTEIDAGRTGTILPTSSVVTKEETCPKGVTGNCDLCRQCWDRKIKHVTYKAF